MKVLITGGGGREHALAWKAAQSPLVTEVFVAPGNAGTAMEDRINNVDLPATDFDGLIRFAMDTEIELTIIGPEAPLVLGIVDAFKSVGLKCFGPSKSASRLEGSKTFSKQFLARHSIPTAAFESFVKVGPALDYLKTTSCPLVIKADGLAAGKGVIIAKNRQQAEQAIKDMLTGNQFGEAGRRVVIEQFLHGEEASFICMIDGKNILPMASSQDYKKAGNGDIGPNTGGMGACSPAPGLTDEIHNRVMNCIMRPTIDGLRAEGVSYTGFLYAGLMIGNDSIPRVLEFNCRFGDPETQPVMMRMQSDIVAHCLAALDQKLDREVAVWDHRPALGVVMAASGYPGEYKKSEVVRGLDGPDSEGLKIFHAGTRLHNNQVLTNGGRVLCVTALGETVRECQDRVYQATDRIGWSGSWFRGDIGHLAID